MASGTNNPGRTNDSQRIASVLGQPRLYCNGAQLTALRFSGGPSSHRNTQQDAITGASRTIDEEPRLAPAKTHTPERPSAANACYAALWALEYDL